MILTGYLFVCLFCLSVLQTAQGLSFYMPSLISTFGYSPITANALSAPVYAVAMGAAILNSLLLSRSVAKGEMKSWYRHLIIPLCCASVTFAGFTVAIHEREQISEFTLLFVCTALAFCYTGPFQAWSHSLFTSKTEAAVGVAWIGALSHLSGFIGPQLFVLARNSKVAAESEGAAKNWPAIVGMSLACALAAVIVIIWMYTAWGEEDAQALKAELEDPEVRGLPDTPQSRRAAAAALAAQERKSLLDDQDEP